MNSIFHIIKEEQERLNEVIEAFHQALDKEERGSPQIKKHRNKEYLYLASRENGKVKFKYIGPADSEKAATALASLNKRREYAERIRKIKADLKDTKKALRGRIL